MKKAKTATITRQGIKKAEKYFNVTNLMDPENITLLHHINQAKHTELCVLTRLCCKDDEVIIVIVYRTIDVR